MNYFSTRERMSGAELFVALALFAMIALGIFIDCFFEGEEPEYSEDD